MEDPALGAAGGDTAADRKVAPPGKPAVTAETADNKAIVLVPEKLDPKADVEVIMFFHGINVGNRSFGADRSATSTSTGIGWSSRWRPAAPPN